MYVCMYVCMYILYLQMEPPRLPMRSVGILEQCGRFQKHPVVSDAITCIRQHTSAYVSIRQHASAYVSIRQHTSAYVSTP